MSTLLKKIWQIARPVLTLGLSVGINAASKSAGRLDQVAQATGEMVKNSLINAVSETVEDFDEKHSGTAARQTSVKKSTKKRQKTGGQKTGNN